MRRKRGEWSFYGPSKRRRRRFRLLGVALVLMVVFLLIDTFVVSSLRVETEAMAPTIKADDRVAILYFLYKRVLTTPLLAKVSPHRGDIVVVRAPFARKKPLAVRLLKSIASIFTLRMVDIFPSPPWETPFHLRRVVGIPGDTIRIRDSLAEIKPRGANFFSTEPAGHQGSYEILSQKFPAGWRTEYPLPGSGISFVLEEGEYFLLSDNRSVISDSRSWGPVKRSAILGKTILRYWPLGELALL